MKERRRHEAGGETTRALLHGIACLAMSCAIGAARAERTALSCSAHSASLQRFLKAQGIDATGPLIALADLDGDRQPEALVYLRGSDWCGSGGCSLLVLRHKHGAWHRVSRTSVSRLPVRLLERRHHGWRSLQISVGGGGIAAHDVVLDFDGRRYPANPTLLPGTVGPKDTGRTLIELTSDGTPRCER